MPKITVLRLGHRVRRDKRVSTHCALVARALGAEEIIFSGEKDAAVLESIEGVKRNWGGSFKAKYEKNWRRVLKAKALKVHLTFYGMQLQELMPEIRKNVKRRNLLVVIGAEKVPSEVYEQCDYNIAVTNQPHSEIAALALFLHELFEGKELYSKVQDKVGSKYRIKIEPQKKGKLVLRKS